MSHIMDQLEAQLKSVKDELSKCKADDQLERSTSRWLKLIHDEFKHGINGGDDPLITWRVLSRMTNPCDSNYRLHQFLSLYVRNTVYEDDIPF